MNSGLGATYYYAGRYDEAMAQYQKTLAFDPTFSIAHEMLAEIYERTGREDEAVEEYLKANPHWIGSKEIADALKTAAAQSSVHGLWRKWLEFAVDKSKIATISFFYIAATYAYLGETESAFEWLEKAFEEREGFLVHLKTDPHFNKLHADVRFQDLVRRIGIP
jgi:tetratricopeptide (TPR) repeat protein